MITVSDFHNGLTFEYSGNLYSIISFLHVKPGKGGAFVRTKLRNMRSGNVIEKTFRPGEKFREIRLEEKRFQFLYRDNDDYVFMDLESFDQITLTLEQVGTRSKYLKEEMEITIGFVDDDPLEINLPNFVQLVVVQTDPGLKGDTAAGGTKPATLETGAVIQVPLFIKEGDRLRIDTRKDEYMERA